MTLTSDAARDAARLRLARLIKRAIGAEMINSAGGMPCFWMIVATEAIAADRLRRSVRGNLSIYTCRRTVHMHLEGCSTFGYQSYGGLHGGG